MAAINNTQGITKITMPRKVIHNYCPMGDDWYTNNLVIIIEPDELIPDYVDIDKDIKELEGKKLIIEDVVSAVFNNIETKYKPKYLRVSSYVEDAVHLPVTVEKETK